jgi:dihydrolipoamide dehydrogenase
MPQLSDTMTEGTVVKWYKKEGDKVKEGEKVADVETDKAVMEMESSEAGTLAAILVKEGQKVAVGAQLALIAKGNENIADVKKTAASAQASQASLASARPERAAAVSSQSTKQPANAPINVPTPGNPAVPTPAPHMSKPAPSPARAIGNYNFDLIVIGGGPAGYAAAIRAGQLKKRVLCVEKENLGGTCLNWGCIPTKALLENGAMVRKMRDHAGEFGISFDNLKVDFTKIISRSRAIADKLSKGIAHLFRKYEVKSEFGTGQVVAPHKVKVMGKDGPKEFTAENILICTGARARTLPGVEIDGVKIITSREAMILPKQPKKLAIIGAGAIGCEFADFYNAMGTEVEIVELLDHLLPIEDEDCSVLLERIFQKRGIKVHIKTKTEKVEKTANGVKLTVSNATKGSGSVEADMVLMAVGVTGNVENLFASSVPVELFKNHIKVDKSYRTNVEGIYAAGDVIGPPWLAHIAHHEAVKAVEMIFGHHVESIDYKNIPGCTYTHPQVASMGLTEKKAREEKREIRVGKFPFAASGRALAAGESDGFVKLIFDAKYGELLGVHMIGENVTELLAELVLAKNLEATEEEIIEAMHPHPTLSEAVMEAAGVAEGRAIHL